MADKLVICTHHKFNLKGCNRKAGHEGLHRNIYDTTDERWADDAGTYVNTREHWVALVNALGTGLPPKI